MDRHPRQMLVTGGISPAHSKQLASTSAPDSILNLQESQPTVEASSGHVASLVAGDPA